MQAFVEAIREQILSILSYVDPNDDMREMVHNAILDHCGLLQKVRALEVIRFTSQTGALLQFKNIYPN
ncbi:unnamed protein product [Cylicostephanus goldi]|uniref:Uncharacterized protein n=1 Tax=Cylicostephanus goldi TaxID=71465 RepID=A0A3P6S2P6_CYLGO|nr:unnamed protein product [Cylicostephanus goldi]